MAKLQRQVSVSSAPSSDQLLVVITSVRPVWLCLPWKVESLPSGKAAVGAGWVLQLKGARALRGARKRVGGQFLGIVLKGSSVAVE